MKLRRQKVQTRRDAREEEAEHDGEDAETDVDAERHAEDDESEGDRDEEHADPLRESAWPSGRERTAHHGTMADLGIGS